jgi:hypothetical protein
VLDSDGSSSAQSALGILSLRLFPFITWSSDVTNSSTRKRLSRSYYSQPNRNRNQTSHFNPFLSQCAHEGSSSEHFRLAARQIVHPFQDFGLRLNCFPVIPVLCDRLNQLTKASYHRRLRSLGSLPPVFFVKPRKLVNPGILNVIFSIQTIRV